MPAFEPLVGEGVRVLVLGSMPSKSSLSRQQYYAHPRNSFWWIMSELYDFDLAASYEARCKALVDARVGVWDVLYDCIRSGSLDSAIERHSELSNDFSVFFSKYASIDCLIFNGLASSSIFKRHNRGLLELLKSQRPNFKWVCCPSTSPAHASMSKPDKLEVWRQAVN